MIQNIKTFTKLALSVLLILMISGCFVKKYELDIPFVKEKKEEKKPTFTNIEFQVSKEVNPDINGRPSPVVLRIYELSSRTAFDNNDFFALYEKPGDVLGPDMISQEEFEFTPGKEQSHKMSLGKNTKYIGVIVAYRDISNSRWRALIKVDPEKDNNILIAVDKLSVYTEEKE